MSAVCEGDGKPSAMERDDAVLRPPKARTHTKSVGGLRKLRSSNVSRTEGRKPGSRSLRLKMRILWVVSGLQKKHCGRDRGRKGFQRALLKGLGKGASTTTMPGPLIPGEIGGGVEPNRGGYHDDFPLDTTVAQVSQGYMPHRLCPRLACPRQRPDLAAPLPSGG
jgi:hypothetical protein